MADKKALEVILEIKDQFSKTLQRFESHAKGAMSKVTGLVTAGATAFLAFGQALGAVARIAGAFFRTVVTVGRHAKEILDGLVEKHDRLDMFSKRLGVTVEALQKLHYAAKLSQLNIQAFDVGLQRMTRRLAEVRETGKGVAVDALELLNLKINDFRGLSPDESFLRLADAFNELEDQGTKVLAAFKLFDTEGVGMVQLFERGRDKLEGFMHEAEKLGIVFSEQQLARAKRLGDIFFKISAAFTALKERIVVDLAPALTHLGEKVLGWYIQNRQKIIASFAAIAKDLPSFFDMLYLAAKPLVIATGVSLGDLLGTAIIDGMLAVFGRIKNTPLVKTIRKIFPATWAQDALGVDIEDWWMGQIKKLVGGVGESSDRAWGRFRNAAIESFKEIERYWNELKLTFGGTIGGGGRKASTAGGRGRSGAYADVEVELRDSAAVLTDISQGAAQAMSSAFQVSFFDPMTQRFRDLQQIGTDAIRNILSSLASLMAQLGFRVLSGAIGSLFPTGGQGNLSALRTIYPEVFTNAPSANPMGIPAMPAPRGVGGGGGVSINYTINAADARGVRGVMESERGRILSILQTDGEARRVVKGIALGR